MDVREFDQRPFEDGTPRRMPAEGVVNRKQDQGGTAELDSGTDWIPPKEGLLTPARLNHGAMETGEDEGDDEEERSIRRQMAALREECDRGCELDRGKLMELMR